MKKQNLTARFHVAALAALCFTTPTIFAGTTHTWSGAGGNQLFSNPANWASGGVPAAGATVTLYFPNSGTAAATVDVPNLTAYLIEVSRPNFTLSGAGAAVPIAIHILDAQAATNVVLAESLPVNLPTNTFYVVGSNTTVRIFSRLAGPGGLRIDSGSSGYPVGFFSVELGGSQTNTFQGETDVSGSALLRLAKPAGVTALPGDVLVHGGARLKWEANEQLPNTGTTLEFSQSGVSPSYPDLNGRTETLGTLICNGDPFSLGTTLDLQGGSLSAAAFEFVRMADLWNGSLTLRGDLNVRDWPMDFWVPLALGVTPRGNTISATNANAYFNAPISGPSSASVRFTSELGTFDFPPTFALLATNTYAGNTFVNTARVVVNNSASLGASSAGTFVSENGRIALVASMTLNEPFTLDRGTNSPSFPTGIWVEPGATNVTLAGALTIANDVSLEISASTSTVSLSGLVSGGGTLHKGGSGVLSFTGAQTNTFSGGFELWTGSAELRRAANATALPGPVILHPNGTLRSFASHQIADAATMFFDDGGLFDLQGYTEIIAGLDFTGAGTINGSGGGLQVNTNVLVRELSAYATVNAPLILGGAGVAVDVEDAPGSIPLRFTGVVSGNALTPLLKTGTGRLELWGANTYSGPTFVNAGVLALKHAQALGSTTGGTTVASNAVLELAIFSSIHGEALALSDGKLLANLATTNTWGGLVSVGGAPTIETFHASNRVVLTNLVSGAGGLIKTGPGTLELSGASPNTYAGETVVSGGALVLKKTTGPAVSGASLGIGYQPRSIVPATAAVSSQAASQVGDASAVSISSLGSWNLNGFNDTIGSLAGAGQVTLGNATLTHGSLGTDTTFAGSISGSATISLTKTGPGTFTMTGNNSYTGRTQISGGKVLINGTNSASSLVTVAPATTLGGSGQMGNITATGGSISPGNSPGRMRTGNLIWNPFVTYQCELQGTNAGANYDQIAVTGTVTLGGAALNLSLGLAGAVSNRYTLIENDGVDAVAGTFIDRPEGATFYASGVPFRISYVGGTGNDVVLTQLGLQQKPQIGSVKKLPNGQIEINGTGIPDLLYSVYAATNVVSTNWPDLGFIQASPAGALQFVDPDAPLFPMRFYQFVLPPFNQ